MNEERKFETLLTQYGQAMQKLALVDADVMAHSTTIQPIALAERQRVAAKAVKAKANLRNFLKDVLAGRQP